MATRRREDSDEGDATALDLRASPRPTRQPERPTPSPRPRPAASAAGTTKSPDPPSNGVDSDDDNDATEFLAARPAAREPSRHTSGEAIPRAHGRAVSIEHGSSSSSAQVLAPLPAPITTLSLGQLAALDARPAMTTRHEPIRPLPHRPIGGDVSSTGTASAPRVTRIQVASNGDSTTHGDGSAAPESTGETTLPPRQPVQAVAALSAARRVATHVSSPDNADDTEASDGSEEGLVAAPSPPPMPLPPPASSSSSSVNARGHRRVPPSAEGAPAIRRAAAPAQEPQDGILVVDAPPEATVTVNGVERGRGTIKVTDLDREARHAVRIQCHGFFPWKGSVSLQGKPAAKIRPALKPRSR